MQIDTAGTYTLKYTAEDACGNVTEVTREVVAEAPATYRTVLYTDGTFIINESSRDQAANEALHGAATNVYVPFNPNGDKYIFTSETFRPWNAQCGDITSVKFGSSVSPTNMNYWFKSFTACKSFDFSGLDTSNVTSMVELFRFCNKLTSLDLSSFNTSNVTDMGSMFDECRILSTLDLSSFDTSKVTRMSNMFYNCQYLTPVLDSFDTSNVTSMRGMFQAMLTLDVLDLSSLDTSKVTDMTNMFSGNNYMTKIFVDPTKFVVGQVTASSNMFAACRYLKGGAGTMWASGNPRDKTYAHVDGGTSNPGYFTAKA